MLQGNYFYPKMSLVHPNSYLPILPALILVNRIAFR